MAARNLIEVIPKCAAVIRPQDTHLAALLRKEGFNIVVNPDPDQGIGSSIVCAIRSFADASGWVIALADMPYIKPVVIEQVVSRLEHGAIISAPVYRHKRGHPVGFSRALLTPLMNLRGDRGAQVLIQEQKSEMTLFQTEDEGVVLDIDRLGDLPETG